MPTFLKCLLASLLCLVAGCSWFDRSNTIANDPRFLNIAGENFRKAGAPNVDILRLGIKKNTVFEPLVMPAIGDAVPVYLSTEAFSAETRKAVIDVGGKAGNEIASGLASLGTSAERSSTATFKVFTVRDMQHLVNELNTPANAEALRVLTRYDEPRIVVGVAVAFSHASQINNTLKGDFGLHITTFSSAPEIELGGSDSKTSTVKLSDGTVFAYRLARLCWEDDGKDGVRIAALDMDRPLYADGACPRGTFKNVNDLRESKAAQLASRTAP